MSDVTFSCPSCGQHIACDETYSGERVPCPTCQAETTVPSREAPASPPLPPPIPTSVPPVRAPAVALPTSGAKERVERSSEWPYEELSEASSGRRSGAGGRTGRGVALLAFWGVILVVVALRLPQEFAVKPGMDSPKPSTFVLFCGGLALCGIMHAFSLMHAGVSSKPLDDRIRKLVGQGLSKERMLQTLVDEVAWAPSSGNKLAIRSETPRALGNLIVGGADYRETVAWLQRQVGLPLHKLFVEYRSTVSVVQYLAACVEGCFAGAEGQTPNLEFYFRSVKVSRLLGLLVPLLPGEHIVAVNGEVIETVADLQDRVRGRDGKAKFTVLSWGPLSSGPSQLSDPTRVVRCGEVDLDPSVLDGKIEDSCEGRAWVNSNFVVGFAADRGAAVVETKGV